MKDKSKKGNKTFRTAYSDRSDDHDETLLDGIKGVPDGIKRGVESLLGDSRVRNIVSEIKLPREIVTHIVSGIDETKQAAVGVVAKEVREFLEHTNLADEVAKLLTQISFEVSTQVRFIPSDKVYKRKKKDKAEEEPTAEQEASPPERTAKPPKRSGRPGRRTSRPPEKIEEDEK
jgi:hypothetical protein